VRLLILKLGKGFLMRNRKIISIIFLIVGFTFSGMILFADALGLDDHSGWGRLRIAAFIASLSVMAFAALYLLFPGRLEWMAANLCARIGRNPLVSSLLKSRLAAFAREYSFTFPIMAFVILIYIWLVSSGTWTTWISPTRYYADLARGFERGKLFITLAPDPKLGELPDPYDPFIRKEAGIETPVDVTYFNERFYLYWGPVPSILLLPVKAIYHGRVGDLQLTFGFTCGIFILLSMLVIHIRDRFFRGLPKWMLGLSLVLIGTANPILYMLNNYNSARIYEAAIVGGQFFLVGGLLAAITALGQPSSHWKLALAGSLWALSIGTRLSLVLPVGVMAFVMFCSWIMMKSRLLEKIANLFSLGIPLAWGGVTLGWYNWARFGKVTESGLYYQLAGVDLQKNYNILILPDYFFQNLYNYLVRPFVFDSQFPFVRVQVGRVPPIFPSYSLPQLYATQQITGLLVAVPFVLFACIPIWQLIAGKYKDHQGRQNALYWIVLMLGGSFVPAFIFLMSFFWAAMRYLEDFMPSLLALSVIGFWQGYSSFAPESVARKRFAVLGASLAGISMFVSLAVAVSINAVRFEIVRAFSFLK
jgi:hypothetical protein